MLDTIIDVSVTGMTCNHCVMSVTEELNEVPGVTNVMVELNPKDVSTVKVVVSKPVEDDALRDAIAEAGFETVGIKRDF